MNVYTIVCLCLSLAYGSLHASEQKEEHGTIKALILSRNPADWTRARVSCREFNSTEKRRFEERLRRQTQEAYNNARFPSRIPRLVQSEKSKCSPGQKMRYFSKREQEKPLYVSSMDMGVFEFIAVAYDGFKNKKKQFHTELRTSFRVVWRDIQQYGYSDIKAGESADTNFIPGCLVFAMDGDE